MFMLGTRVPFLQKASKLCIRIWKIRRVGFESGLSELTVSQNLSSYPDLLSLIVDSE